MLDDKNLNLTFLISDLKTHYLSNYLLINELTRRKHHVKTIKLSHAEKTSNAINLVSEDSIALVERLTEKLENRCSILLLHGISAYKNNYVRSIKKYDNILVPTESWVKGREATLKEKQKNLFCSNGWNKLDWYYKFLKNKQTIKEYIYNKYKFDKNKKLIVYAPTGYRMGYETFKKWQTNNWSKKLYQDHGIGYLKKDILKIIRKHANVYAIDHPCVNREDIVQDRLKVMAIADLFIGDISSMTLEFSVMDKPIIQISKNKEDSFDGDFNMFHNPNLELLDFGPIVSLGDLDKTIKESLVNDFHRERRNNLKDKYVGLFDGRCAKREADTIEEICSQYIKK